MDLNKIYYDVDGNAHNILEMMKEEPEWAANRVQIGEKAIKDNAKLRAQLARCVDVLTWCGLMFGVNDMPKCQETIHDFIDVELYEQAKADAEVLRCAEKIYQEYFYGNDDEKVMRHNRLLVRGIHNAVRAAREDR